MADPARQALIAGNRRHEKDTGSSEVQIALLTQRIQEITGHLGRHPKDHAARRGLLMLVGQRSSLLRYLSGHDDASYRETLKRLGLRK